MKKSGISSSFYDDGMPDFMGISRVALRTEASDLRNSEI